MKKEPQSKLLDFDDPQRLVSEHGGQIRRMAFHLFRRIPPLLDVEDLIQAGTIGLLHAARDFSSSRGSFGTYAAIRIRGAMIDEIRRVNWTTRSSLTRAKEIASAVAGIEKLKGRPPKATEIAGALGLSIDEYDRIKMQTEFNDPIYLEGSEEQVRDQGPSSEGPDDVLEREQLQKAVIKAIDELPKRMQLVLALYYHGGWSQTDIGRLLRLCESRVHQIRSEAVKRVRRRLLKMSKQLEGQAMAA